MRKRLGRNGRRHFKKDAKITKAINVRPMVKRGGIKL